MLLQIYIEHIILYWGLSLVINLLTEPRIHPQHIKRIPNVLINQLIVNLIVYPFINNVNNNHAEFNLYGMFIGITLLTYYIINNKILEKPLNILLGNLICYVPLGYLMINLTTFYLVEFLLTIVSISVLFYIVHYIIHQKPLYNLIHKQHHWWNTSLAFSALDSHPAEHLLGNLLPTMLPAYLLNSNVEFVRLIAHFTTINTLLAHQYMPHDQLQNNHQTHHYVVNKQFGITGPLDKWFSTNYN